MTAALAQASQELPRARSVLAVCAHPDDESFGLGAVLDRFVSDGAEVTVLCFTHGEASTLGVPGPTLGDLRRAELAAAAAELGIGRVELLGHPDGALGAVALDELTAAVATMAGEVRADLLVVFDEGGVTGHPDHCRATEAALAGAPTVDALAWVVPRAVADALNAAFGTTFLGRGDDEIDMTCSVDRARQWRAIARHESQCGDNPVLDQRLQLLGERESLRWLRRLPRPQAARTAAPEAARPAGAVRLAERGMEHTRDGRNEPVDQRQEETMSTAANGALPEITAQELATVLGTERAPTLIDVREPEEFEAWALSGARNVPLSHLASKMGELEDGRDLVVICASGARSARAVQALRGAGIPALNLAGGMLAWAEVYDTATVDLDAARIVQLRRRGKGCLSYVVGAGEEAFVVDPSLDVDRYLDVAATNGWRITRVFDTHLHADHLSGVRALARATGATVHLNPADGYRFDFEPLEDTQWFDLGNEEHFGVTVLGSPGHTPGSTVFEVGGRALLTGDTLFVDGVGRPDLADRADDYAHDLHHSLHSKVLAMPVDALVLPAHYGDMVVVVPDTIVGASLGTLRSSLPQLSWPEAEFVAWAAGRARPRPSHYREIVGINAGTTTLPPEDARRLELGPNRCAA